MKHVFISYLRDDEREVKKLTNSLKNEGIRVWLDKEKISPGLFWKDSIRKAISDGDFFIACFSENYPSKPKTYMNEELILAIEELRKRQFDQAWFIPVLFSGEIPDISIGAGRSLLDIQYVDLRNRSSWENGVEQIINAIRDNDELIIDTIKRERYKTTELGYYKTIKNSPNIDFEDAKEYFINALKRGWPLLCICQRFKSEVIELLYSLVIDDEFVEWGRSLALLLCIEEKSPLKIEEKIKPKLKKIGRSPNRVLRRHLYAIGNCLGDTELLNRFDLSDHSQYLAYVEYAGGLGPSFKALDLVLDASSVEDKYVRRAAAAALSRFGNFRAVDRLTEMIDDSDIGVQNEVLISLAYMANLSSNTFFHYLISNNENRRNVFPSKIGAPYLDSQYENVFRKKKRFWKRRKSHIDYLHDLVVSSCHNDNDSLLALSILGNMTSLERLLGDCDHFLWNKDTRLRDNFLATIHALDEKLHSKDAFNSLFQKTAVINRWWYSGGHLGQDIEFEAFSYFENEATQVD